MIFVINADTSPIDRGCVGEFDVAVYRILAGARCCRVLHLVVGLVGLVPDTGPSS